MTDEQLAWITEQVDRAAHKAAHRTMKGAVIGYVILFLGVLGMYFNGQSVSKKERGAVVDSGRIVSVDGCNRDYNTIQTLRDEISKSKKRTQQLVKEGTLTQAQADRAIEQTNDLLERYQLPDCRKAETVLTDNPEDVSKQPVPRFPPSEDK
jgi:hypothetical protein